MKIGNGGSGNLDGAWTVTTVTGQNKPASNDKELFCKTSGSWVKFRFTGNRVRYITEIAMVGAGVDAYIDGTKVAELDCFTNSSSIYERNYVAFDSADYDLILEDGAHVLKLVGYLDEKNTTAFTNCIFRVDAFDSYPDTVKTVSTKTLASQVAKVSAISSIGVTKDSWNNLQDKLENAGAILQDANATEEAVSAALTELQSAESSLVPTDMSIKAITSLMPVKVTIGTSEEQLEKVLPDSVIVKTDDGQSYRVAIVWDVKGFDGSKAGEYTLKGTLVPDKAVGLTNPDNLQAEVTVMVSKHNASIVLGNLAQTENAVTPVTAETEPAGLAVQILYDGKEDLPATVGKYGVEARIVDNAYTGTARATLVISEVVVDPVEEAREAQKQAEEKAAAAKLAEEKAREAQKQAEEKAAAEKLAAEKAQAASDATAAALKEALEKAKAEADAAAKTAEKYKAQAEKLIRASLGKPDIKLTNMASSKITINWSKQTDVSGYEIYRADSKNGAYTKINTISSGSTVKYTDSKLTCGKTYYYKVCAYKESSIGRIYGDYSKTAKLKATPAPAVIAKATGGKRSATVQVKKQNGISGYEIYRAVQKNGAYKKVNTIKAGKKLTFQNSKLTARKTYYYKARAYKKVGKKTVYGPYSAVKSVKVK